MLFYKLANVEGLEPSSQGFGDPHLTIRTHEYNLVVPDGNDPSSCAYQAHVITSIL